MGWRVTGGGGSVREGWGCAGGYMSVLMGVLFSQVAKWEGENVPPGVVVGSVGRSQPNSVRFRTNQSGQDCRLRWANHMGGGIFGTNPGAFSWAASFHGAPSVLTSAVQLISRGSNGDQRVLTLDSDGLLRVYDKNDTLILTSDTAIPFLTHTRFALVLEAFAAEHGGNWLLWLVQEVSGTLTEVGAAEIAADSWVSESQGWVWGEKLPAGVDRGDGYNLDDIHNLATFGGNAHADVAPHLATVPFGGVFAQDHSTDGGLTQWTPVGNSPQNQHSKNWQDGEDGDATYNRAETVNLVDRVAGDAISGIAAGDTVLVGTSVRGLSRTVTGSKFSADSLIHWNGNSSGSGYTPKPGDSYVVSANGGTLLKPGLPPEERETDWDGAEIVTVEFGTRTRASNHDMEWRVTGCAAYWVKKVADMPLLSLPTDTRMLERGFARGVLRGISRGAA